MAAFQGKVVLFGHETVVNTWTPLPPGSRERRDVVQPVRSEARRQVIADPGVIERLWVRSRRDRARLDVVEVHVGVANRCAPLSGLLLNR